MNFRGSIGRTALGGIASAVLAFGIGGTAAQAQEPIKIGVTLTQSPPGSVIQGTEVLRGLEIARDLFNEQGGVLDRPFELIVEDTQGIPERGRAAVEKLITSDEVVALTGEHQSSVCLAEIGLAARHNVPFINTNCWSDDIRKEGHPQVFSPNMYNSRVGRAMAEVIEGLGVDSVFALAENTDWGIGQAEALKELLAQTGAEVDYQYEILDREARDFTPVIQGVRGENPSLIALIMLPPAAYVALNQLNEQGVIPSADTWLFEGGGLFSYPDFWDNVREAALYGIYFDLFHTDMALRRPGARRVHGASRRHAQPARLPGRRFAAPDQGGDRQRRQHRSGCHDPVAAAGQGPGHPRHDHLQRRARPFVPAVGRHALRDLPGHRARSDARGDHADLGARSRRAARSAASAQELGSSAAGRGVPAGLGLPGGACGRSSDADP
jgi:branched-chain amino acid transport system substrate-binding protein